MKAREISSFTMRVGGLYYSLNETDFTSVIMRVGKLHYSLNETSATMRFGRLHYSHRQPFSGALFNSF